MDKPYQFSSNHTSILHLCKATQKQLHQNVFNYWLFLFFLLSSSIDCSKNWYRKLFLIPFSIMVYLSVFRQSFHTLGSVLCVATGHHLLFTCEQMESINIFAILTCKNRQVLVQTFQRWGTVFKHLNLTPFHSDCELAVPVCWFVPGITCSLLVF